MATLRDRWQAASPYIDEALSLSGEQRAVWLEGLRERDPALASVLRVFLEEHRELDAAGFLENAPFAATVLEGQSVGAYRLVSEIGRGGMGTVWLAERNDGRFERRVAIKFLNVALGGGPTGQERFRREGAILGRLAHPHIAELIDAGVHLTGQPYLVLEYVDGGEPIDRYCEQRELDVKARVRLFLDVLAAVAHAHANLVVHRDIKPSNVLVNTNDGQVKLLDFGIAKLMIDGEGGAAALTRDGMGPLTPEYAAPEQLTGGNVTTATDVYSLGVLLYLLLAGRHPAAAVSDATLRPETRLALRGDLNTIVAKALKNSPEERYASVTAFAEDLRRYLANEPILARPDSFVYRTGRFVRRNRLAVASVALACAALIVTAAIAVQQAAEARERFNQVRRMAHTSLFDFYPELDRVPGNTKATAMLVSTAREYLDNLAKSAGNDRGLLIELAEAYEKLASAQGNSGRPNLAQRNGALDSRSRALEIRSRLTGRSREEELTILWLMSALTDDLRNLGRTSEAASMGKRAIEAGERLLASSEDRKASDLLLGASTAYTNFSRVLSELGRLEEAESSLATGERLLMESLGGKITRHSIAARQDRGDLLISLGRLTEAEGVLHKAEQENEVLLREAKQGPEFLAAYRNRQVTWASLAELYDSALNASLEQPEKAMRYRVKLREGWEHLIQLDPNDNSARTDLAVCESETALTLMKIDRVGAIAAARRGLAMFQSLERSSIDDVAVVYRSARAATRLAMTLTAGGGHASEEEARSLIAGSVAKHRALIARHGDNLGFRSSLVWTLTVQGRVEAGVVRRRAVLEEAVRIAESSTMGLDLQPLRVAAEARFAYAETLEGEERCGSLRRVRELWARWKGHGSEWVERQRAVAERRGCLGR